MARMPTYFISHGGGPWPWVEDMRKLFPVLEKSLAAMPDELPEPPRAILMISGHWEADDLRVMHSAKPPMVYDYFGFPPHTYDVVYPAPGAPEIAERAQALLAEAGIDATLDDTQGFDHGTFVPAYIMYPEANVPVFQVSLLSNYDPEAHFAIGRALAPLRDEGVLIVGSGLSYHNLRLFGPGAKEPSAAFDAWLHEVLDLGPEDRTDKLIKWETAPHARVCHAQEDHLVPLFAALGAAEDGKATVTYHQNDMMGGVTATSWRFD
ncbi:class III extradiol ring-cleavage dioxygenase [Maritimibacter sp. UBA3975]|uniref:DODA-type extradiol aromatic ring-opening family dioxygenase n=1 Tax=Maritimibacter sp. UBA3975 TaxID=1946833 RepID=UPI000C0A307E|nr:class III extradiol ring-cleavage dioxygenase [Maritimibacter sp. UBA3975]MAM61936.1 dioxygenase [Maritimibacter sp.]